MISGNTSVERVTIEHLTIRSGKTFAAVRAALEALVPRLDDGFWTLLRFGLTDRARQELEAAATLSIFGSRDHGVLLAIAGSKQQAVQYDIGNPLTASLMTRHELSAASTPPFGSCFWKVPRMALHLNTIDRFRPSDSLAMKESISLLGNSTNIWRMSCRKPRTSSTKAAPSRYREGRFASTPSVPALSRKRAESAQLRRRRPRSAMPA